jgi:integrase
VAKSSFSKTAVDRRADELDTIASVLPIDRRDELAELLTDQDIETLRHLVNEGMGENTLRALTSDLAYLQAWSLAATGASLPWPAPEALALKFVAHHLWQPEQREVDPQHGMPAAVEQSLREQGFLRSSGPHAPDTVRRRIASWSTLTKWRGLTGVFSAPSLKSAIRLAVRATPRPRKRKSAKAVTGDVLAKMLATCSTGSLRDIRDRAILMVAFASGGRRRSEIAGLRREQLTVEPPITTEGGPPSRSYQNVRLRARRGRLSDGPARGCAQCLACSCQDREREHFSEGRSLGQCFEAGTGAICRQCDRQAAGGAGGAGSRGVFGARTEIGVSDRSGQSRHPSARSDGAIASPLSSASIQLL